MSATPPYETDPDATTVRPTDPGDARSQPASVGPGRRRGGRAPMIAAVVGTLVVLLGGLYLAGYLLAGDKLPKNARVSGVEVGGLSRTAAVQKLTADLGERAGAPIKVAAGDTADEVRPADAGLQVDYAKSVAGAGGGRSANPARILRVLTGGSSTEAVTLVDEAELSTAVRDLAERMDQRPVDATIAYDGAEITRTDAEDGLALDQEATATILEDHFLLPRGAAVELPVTTTEPQVSTAEADDVVASFAEPAVSAPIEVGAGQAGAFELSPAMIADAVSFEVRDGSLAPRLDATRLRESADPVIEKVEVSKPKNATVRIVDGKPKVIPAVNGTTIGAMELAKAIEPALTKTGSQRRADVELSGAEAGFSTEEAAALNIKEVTGEFTTNFPYASYRNTNIGRAAELINNTLLKPGDTFSLNRTVGERTAANGFTEGFVISGGKFRKELGGGVSQSATTTFNAMFFAGLEDVEHKPHTLYINRYPAGREATVAWPNLDLKFKNDTEHGVLVQASVSKAAPGRQGSITVKMWSTKIYDRVTATKTVRSNFTTGRDVDDDSADCEPTSPVRGFDAAYQRLFYRDGKVVKRESFRWRYGPTDRVTCG